MTQSVYTSKSYKPFLLQLIRNAPHGGHGMRKKLAEAMGCQLTYVSQVLNGSRHLSVDQAEAAARFFGLDADEAECFIWLVEWERAGTVAARKFFLRLIERKRSEYLQLRNRVSISDDLKDSDKATYYGDPLYAAVHMAVTIPEYRTTEALVRRFRQPSERIKGILAFLKARGLVEERKGQLEPGSRYLFIEKKSPFILQHHSNWRMQALQSVARREEDSVHLSMVVSLSDKDAAVLRTRIGQFVEELSATIKVSREERLMVMNLDFFDF
jgi:transcriptional regulator with XRE-family HTH domain